MHDGSGNNVVSRRAFNCRSCKKAASLLSFGVCDKLGKKNKYEVRFHVIILVFNGKYWSIFYFCLQYLQLTPRLKPYTTKFATGLPQIDTLQFDVGLVSVPNNFGPFHIIL